MLARDFHALLASSGLATGPAPRSEPDGAPPGRASSVWWMATRGTRWVADRCTDLLPDLLRLAWEEYRQEGRGTAPLLDRASAEATALALEELGVGSVLGGAPAGYVRRVERTGTKRILVPGGDWAAAGSESTGTTPITG
jgi:hypothetical protein